MSKEAAEEPKIKVAPHTRIYVESFGVTRQGTVVRQIDDEHLLFILADYPGTLYTAAIDRVRLKLNEIDIRESEIKPLRGLYEGS